jgi:hypothetical protein
MTPVMLSLLRMASGGALDARRRAERAAQRSERKDEHDESEAPHHGAIMDPFWRLTRASIPRFTLVAMMTLLIAAALAGLGTLDSGTGTPTPTPNAHHQEVAERGDHVMGFSHEKATHHFRLSQNGGTIEVSANDPNDAETRDAIRMHLAHVAKKFAAGDFDAPMLIHARVAPGVPVLQKKRLFVQWKYERSPSGGRIRISTKNPEALGAIHEFLRFQIQDHQTGD